MTTLMDSILLGFHNFPFFAILFTIPFFMLPVIKHKSFNLVRIGLEYMFLLYGLCVIALVLFPLPTLEEAGLLHGYRIQCHPFQFVVDIVKNSPFDITNPRTYLYAVIDQTVLQVVFNVLMTIPFGMFLTYYWGVDKKKVILFSFLLSFVIELTQLTGIYGIYSGSYRLCDVDDLMANTLGGYLGYCVVDSVRSYVPKIESFDKRIVTFSKLWKEIAA